MLAPGLAVTGVAGVVLLPAGFSGAIGLAWRRSDPRGLEFESLGEQLRRLSLAGYSPVIAVQDAARSGLA